MEILLFVIFSLMALVGAFLVISSQNPIHSAISLICSLLGVAGLFALLTAPFMAIIQVLIYAGAIMVLMLFVIMMLNLSKEDLAWDRRDIIWPLGIVLSLLVFYEFIQVVPRYLSPSPQGPGPGFGSITEIGRLLFKEYLLPFELISVLLLIGILGAVVLSKRRGRPYS